MAQKLFEEYGSDDTSKIKLNIERINNRWNSLQSRWVEHLQIHSSSPPSHTKKYRDLHK
jgi:hypothetical protein